MCCLFGILDYKEALPLNQRKRMLRVLSTECEARGTDATGIAWFAGNRLHIQKAPRPAHRMHYKIAESAHYIMGHTRWTTQGNQAINYNNHPFYGMAGNHPFALAHNGVIYNDRELRQKEKLPATKIETDSYVAVQLLEKNGHVGFTSLARMAEQLRGTFTITVLDETNALYIVRGNNPICVYHFHTAGFYLYASTKEILEKAVKRLGLDKLAHEEVRIMEGEILCITPQGELCWESFDDSRLWQAPLYTWGELYYTPYHRKERKAADKLDELIQVANSLGVDASTVNLLLSLGYSRSDVEELIYDPELLEYCLSDATQCMC